MITKVIKPLVPKWKKSPKAVVAIPVKKKAATVAAKPKFDDLAVKALGFILGELMQAESRRLRWSLKSLVLRPDTWKEPVQG
jgi:hypothetical protein